MTQAILTINAGSSSIKFALFERGEPLRPDAALRGEIDGIGAQPRLKARNAADAVLAELTFADLAGLPADEQHHRTLDFLMQWLREHDGGWQSAYAFLSRITVKEGDTVSLGERVGLSRRTGMARGPELHF